MKRLVLVLALTLGGWGGARAAFACDCQKPKKACECAGQSCPGECAGHDAKKKPDAPPKPSK